MRTFNKLFLTVLAALLILSPLVTATTTISESNIVLSSAGILVDAYGNPFKPANVTDFNVTVAQLITSAAIAWGQITDANATVNQLIALYGAYSWQDAWNATVSDIILNAAIGWSQITGANATVNQLIAASTISWSQITNANATVQQLVETYQDFSWQGTWNSTVVQLASSLTNVDASGWVNSTAYYLGGSQLGFVSPASFIIDVSGSTYRAWHGANSTLLDSSTNATLVLQTVINSVPIAGGTIFVKPPFYGDGNVQINRSDITITSGGIAGSQTPSVTKEVYIRDITISSADQVVANVKLDGLLLDQVNFTGAEDMGQIYFTNSRINARSTVDRRGIMYNNTGACTDIFYHHCVFNILSQADTYGFFTGISGVYAQISQCSLEFDDNNTVFLYQRDHAGLDFCMENVHIFESGGYSGNALVEYAGSASGSGSGLNHARFENLFWEIGGDSMVTVIRIGAGDYNTICQVSFDNVHFTPFGTANFTLIDNDCVNWYPLVNNWVEFNDCMNCNEPGQVLVGSPNTATNFQVTLDVAGMGAYASHGGYNSFSGVNTTATTFVLNHGLAGAANFVLCSFNFTGWNSWTWTATSTQITITVTGTLPASYTVYVYAKYVP